MWLVNKYIRSIWNINVPVMEDPYGLKKKRCRYKEKMDKALQILSRIRETRKGIKNLLWV